MKRLLLLVVVACDPGPSSPANWPGTTPQTAGRNDSASPACGKRLAAKGVQQRHVEVREYARGYMLVVPPSYSSAISEPLIFVLHGHGGHADEVRASFDIEGAAGGKGIFVYPNSLGGGWDLDAETGKNRDVTFFDAMLAQVQSEYCIDLHRVFIAGFSNGAYMANQLACRRSERVRAVATHSGGGPYDSSAGAKYDDHGHLVCGAKPVGSLVIHGTADGTVVPSEGQKSIDQWASANHCGAPTMNGPCATYAHCINPVIACKPPGLGHAVWTEAPKRAWAFFDAQR